MAVLDKPSIRERPGWVGFNERSDRHQQIQRLAIEQMKARIAEQYNIPRSERHERVVEDLELKLEERADPLSCHTVFTGFVHALEKVATAADKAREHMTVLGRKWGERQVPANVVPFAWADYTPSTTWTTTTSFVLSSQPVVTYIPVPQYTNYNTAYRMENGPVANVWQNWVTTSSSSSIQYRVADQTWAAWGNDYTPIATRAYKEWWAQSDASFNVKRDHRGKILVPEGQIYDDRAGDIVDIEVWEERQVIRELEATRRNEEAIAARMASAIEYEMAEKRALELLMSVLDSRQQRQYLENGSILVVTPKGRHVQLKKGWGGNAVEKCARTGKPLKRFCIHPRESMPENDNVLLQKLLLETDEDKFFETAYTTDLQRGVFA